MGVELPRGVIPNEPPVLRNVRLEVEFYKLAAQIAGHPEGRNMADRILARAEAEGRRTGEIIKLMLDEIRRVVKGKDAQGT